MAKNKTSTQANTFIADLNMARSEAIKRSTRVVICKTTNPNAATPACNATAADAWSTGWLIFADTDQNDADTTAANDVLIKIRGALESDLQLSAAASAGTPNPQNLLRFTRTGGSAQVAVFTLCNSGGQVEQCLVTINSIGRAALSTGLVRGEYPGTLGSASSACDAATLVLRAPTVARMGTTTSPSSRLPSPAR